MLKNRFYSRFYNKPTLDYLLERIEKIEAAGHDIIMAEPSLLDNFNIGFDGYDVLGTKKSHPAQSEAVTDSEDRLRGLEAKKTPALKDEGGKLREEVKPEDSDNLIERIYKMESKIKNITGEIQRLRTLVEGSGK